MRLPRYAHVLGWRHCRIALWFALVALSAGGGDADSEYSLALPSATCLNDALRVEWYSADHSHLCLRPLPAAFVCPCARRGRQTRHWLNRMG